MTDLKFFGEKGQFCGFGERGSRFSSNKGYSFLKHGEDTELKEPLFFTCVHMEGDVLFLEPSAVCFVDPFSTTPREAHRTRCEGSKEALEAFLATLDEDVDVY